MEKPPFDMWALEGGGEPCGKIGFLRFRSPPSHLLLSPFTSFLLAHPSPTLALFTALPITIRSIPYCPLRPHRTHRRSLTGSS